MAQPCTRAVRVSVETVSRILKRCHTACEKRKRFGGILVMNRNTHSGTSNISVEKKVLTISSLIRQDGLDIHELPIIVKRTSQTWTPVSRVLPCVDSVKKQTEQEQNFRSNLQSCTTVKEVFKLLEVPSDQVTGYSAAFALQRICQLRATSVAWDGDGIDTFIKTAVLNELYDTVIRDIKSLENNALINLTKCYLSSENFDQPCIFSINTEIENRLADGLFDILQLCELSNLLSKNNNGDEDIVNKIWAHIAMRYSDINETNICDVYRSLPITHKYMVKLLDRRLLKCWWKLTVEDISNIVPCLVRLKSQNRVLLTAFGKSVFMNFNSLTDSQLTHILAGFVSFKFSEPNLLKALDRYIPAKGSNLDTNLLALVIEYKRSSRYLSPAIMDVAAKHFVDNYKNYKPLQAYSVLRAFGHLNYLPTNAGTLFLKIEDYIDKKFSYFTVPHISELLCSFTFVERYPLNFVNKIFSSSFLSRAHSLNDKKIRGETGKWLEMLQSAVLLESHSGLSNLYKLWSPSQHCWMDERHNMIHKQIFSSLEKMFGENIIVRARLSNKSAYFIDFAVWSDISGKLLDKESVKYVDHLYPHKYAMLIQMPESYCVNTGHLLGEYAMRNRHLKLLAYQVIEIPYREVQKLNESQRENYILTKLPEKLRHNLKSNSK